MKLIMVEAALIGCELFEHILTVIRPWALREIEVAAELEHQARLHGAEGMSFETIVASGDAFGASSRQGRPQPCYICYAQGAFVTLDFGIIREGYCSDMTRTVCLEQA